MNGCWLIKSNADGSRVGYKVNALTCQRGSRTDTDRDLAISKDIACNWCQGQTSSEFFTDDCTAATTRGGASTDCQKLSGNFANQNPPIFQFCPTNSLNLMPEGGKSNPLAKSNTVLNPFCSYCHFNLDCAGPTFDCTDANVTTGKSRPTCIDASTVCTDSAQLCSTCSDKSPCTKDSTCVAGQCWPNAKYKAPQIGSADDTSCKGVAGSPIYVNPNYSTDPHSTSGGICIPTNIGTRPTIISKADGTSGNKCSAAGQQCGSNADGSLHDDTSACANNCSCDTFICPPGWTLSCTNYSGMGALFNLLGQGASALGEGAGDIFGNFLKGLKIFGIVIAIVLAIWFLAKMAATFRGL